MFEVRRLLPDKVIIQAMQLEREVFLQIGFIPDGRIQRFEKSEVQAFEI
jgi:hypothetical protein